MNMKFFDDCYNMIALSTCVLNTENNDNWFYGNEQQVKITDNLSAVTTYDNICSDDLSAFDYEVHCFSISFFRDGKLLNRYSYESRFNKNVLGSLANPKLSIEAKLNTLSKLKPGLKTRLKTLTMTTNLTPEEIQAVNAKADELIEAAVSLESSQNNVQVQTVPVEQQINTIDTNINNMQAVPTVEQSKQDFINNTQSVTSEPKKEKKDGINWTFIIIMFVIILGAIIFVFPYLLKNL